MFNVIQTISGQSSVDYFASQQKQISPPSSKFQPKSSSGRKQQFQGANPNPQGQSYESQQKYGGSPSDSKGVHSVNMSLSVSNKGQQSGVKQSNEEYNQASKINVGQSSSQDEMFAGSAEKSYADASQKIMKIKQLELENKIHLLSIENERLNSFLNDSVRESERLNEEVYKWQKMIKQDQENYAQKLNYLLIQNQQLEDVNKKLQYRVQELQNEQKTLAQQFGQEIQEIKSQQLQVEVQELDTQQKKIRDLKKTYEEQIAQQKDKLNKLDYQNQDHKRQAIEEGQSSRELEARLNILIQENLTLTNIIKNQEVHTQKLLFQIDNLTDDFQQTVSKYDRELKDQRLNLKQCLEQLNTKHQLELQNAKQQKFQEINQQLEELCVELGSKEQKIRSLEKTIEQLHREHEGQRRQDNQDHMDLEEQQRQIQIHLEEERNILLEEINSLQLNQEKLESAIVKHTKTIVAREKSTKQALINVATAKAEALQAQLQLKDVMGAKEIEIDSYKNKIDILLSENETLIGRIRIQQREYDTISARVTTLDLEWDQRMKKSLQEFNNQKDKQFEDVYVEQLETLKQEHKIIEKLEKRLVDQQEVRNHLEVQLTQIRQSDLLADEKIKELLKQNEILEKENFSYRDEALACKKTSKAAQNKLMFVEKNYELEKNDLRKQVLRVTHENDTLKQQSEALQIKYTEIESELSQMSNDFDKLQKARGKAMTENHLLLDKQILLEKEKGKNKELLKAQQLQLQNHTNEFKQTKDSFQKNFIEREADLLNKIQEQQSYISSVSTKYNDLLQKARKYRQHILLLRESVYSGRNGDMASTKKSNLDNLYDDLNENELNINYKNQSASNKNLPKALSQFNNTLQQFSTQQKPLVRPASVHQF